MSTHRPPISPSPSPARDAALVAVLACLGPDGLDIQAALDRSLHKSQGVLDPQGRDAALATEITYGAVRLKGRTDFVLRGFLKDPAKLPLEAKLTLGLAAFELIFLDKSPAHAVVNWAVGAIKKRFGEGLGRLANAVLRRVADLGQAPRNQEFYSASARNDADFLSAWLSCPAWIVAALIHDLGREHATNMLEAQLSKPPVGLRFNLLKPQAKAAYDDLADAIPSRGRYPTMILDPEAHAPGLDALEARGLLSRQSAASQFILSDLEPAAWPGPILDVCAGRGGKTCLLIEAGHTIMAACDRSRKRLNSLGRELSRLGLPRVPRAVADAQTTFPFRKRPGTILVDAPCTGFGVLSRRPDAKWKRHRADVATLATLQANILENSFQTIPAGGMLAYITCTLLHRENQAHIDALTASHPNAKVLHITTTPSNLDLHEFFFGALIQKT